MRNLLYRTARLSQTLHDRLGKKTQNPRRARGMALIVVFVSVAILSTSIVEYVYNTRINLHLAQNQRDEVKAYFLARSAVNLQRLALQFQYELESQPGTIGQMISRSNFQLWQYLDLLLPVFSSGMLDAGEYGQLDLEDQGATGFEDIHGSMDFGRPEPEEGKINLNEFNSRDLNQETLNALCGLLWPAQYDDLLGSEQDQVVESRFDVIAAIIDHIDPDSDMTEIDENCVARSAGMGNESSRYRDLDWEAKNEPLVTVDELRMVPGVTPEFMRQFQHNMTVYPVAGAFYVNLADAQMFAGFLCSHIVGAADQVNPCTIPQIAAQVNYLSLALEGWNNFFDNPFTVLSMWMGGGAGSGLTGESFGDALGNGQMNAFKTPSDFPSVLRLMQSSPEHALYFMSFADPQRAQLFGYYAAMGQPIVPPQFGITFDEAAMLRRVSVEMPRIYRIESTGMYGGATRTITAVADFNNDGRLMYWREF